MQFQKTIFRWLPIAALTAAAVWIVNAYPTANGARVLVVGVTEITLPGDGQSTATVAIGAPSGALRVTDGGRRVAVERVRTAESGSSEGIVRAGVLPGPAVLEASAQGFKPVRIAVNITPVTTDRFDDGTPDYLRFAGADAEAFRQSFAWLAEAAYATRPARLPAEIVDCAALLRFAYREALRERDSDWASGLGLEVLPSLPSINGYHYPYTPLGNGIFRVKEGSYASTDVADGTFAQFADAETLRRFNAHIVSRDIRRARQGDLLFYRQEAQHMPDHAMIFIESSQFERSGGPWAVYHTGPSDSDPGEIRRPAIVDLMNHPDPRWRPTPANPTFLGVYRWNILR